MKPTFPAAPSAAPPEAEHIERGRQDAAMLRAAEGASPEAAARAEPVRTAGWYFWDGVEWTDNLADILVRFKKNRALSRTPPPHSGPTPKDDDK